MEASRAAIRGGIASAISRPGNAILDVGIAALNPEEGVAVTNILLRRRIELLARRNPAFDACPSQSHPVSSAEIFNAIGRGEISWLAKCGFNFNQSLQINGATITPLAFASSLGKPDIVEQVINAGADPNFGGNDEISLCPLEIALSLHKYDAAKMLLKHGAQANYVEPGTGMTALMTIAFNRDPDSETDDLIRLLQKYGASLNRADARGDTALHWAARAGNTVYVKQLLQRGADACTKNKKGLKAIDVAATAKAADIKALLAAACPLSQGANP